MIGASFKCGNCGVLTSEVNGCNWRRHLSWARFSRVWCAQLGHKFLALDSCTIFLDGELGSRLFNNAFGYFS